MGIPKERANRCESPGREMLDHWVFYARHLPTISDNFDASGIDDDLKKMHDFLTRAIHFMSLEPGELIDFRWFRLWRQHERRESNLLKYPAARAKNHSGGKRPRGVELKDSQSFRMWTSVSERDRKSVVTL